MNDSICPACGKPNPNTVEICQYCGAVLKKSATVPLDPIHPGDVPVKRKTSDLEATLPGWLRDLRKANSEENEARESAQNNPPEAAKAPSPAASLPRPEPPKPKEPVSPLDFLSGLGQVNAEEEEETPDWLKSLKESMPAPVEPPPALAPKTPGEEPASWLAGLEQSEARNNAPPIESNQNWGFGDQPATFNFDDEVETPQSGASDTPDWLTALKAQDEASHPQPSAAPQPIQSNPEQLSGEDLPDWLASLSETGAEQTPSQPTEQPALPDSETPDWLSSLGGESEFRSPDTQAPAPSESPDWLSSLDRRSETGSQEIPATFPSTETPDWLSSLGGGNEFQSQETPEAPTSAEAPDWRSSLGGENEIGPQETPATPISAETPAWLSSLGDDTLIQQASANAEAAPAGTLPEADLPAWLSGLSELTGDSQPAENKNAAPSSRDESASINFQPAESELPDWMAGLQDSTPPVEPPAASKTELEAISADIPDWMTGLNEEGPVSQPPEPVKSATAEASELPSWLAEAMGEQTAEKPAEPASPLKPFDTGTLGELGSLEQTEALPDWMLNLGKSSEPLKPVEATPVQNTAWVPEATAAVETGVNLEAVSEILSPPPAEIETPVPQPVNQEQNLDSIFSLDMPDWLAGFTPTKAELSEAESPDPSTDVNLQPADLPSWVQAMRPVESVMAETNSSGDKEQEIESSGPLAGLRSVLPGQSGARETHKPKAYSIKLQVSETQQAQATLLEYLLSSEKTPQARPRKKETTISRPLRWIIAASLFLVILLSALSSTISGLQIFPSPNLPAGQSEIVAFKETIENLPDEATVLVVVDYQPGFAGEMEPVTEPVIAQLFGENARLAFISTTPMGSLLSNRLIAKANQGKPDEQQYQPGEQYVNLGYLPGGAGSIKVFAEQPEKTVGQDWSLGNLWKTAALKNISKNETVTLSGFSAIVIVTDNPDTGRLWIEQTEPALRKQPIPILMVVSAQADPMLRPYVVSGQLKGLLAGLEGGTLYEKMLGRSGSARFEWDSFGAALLVTELLILGGGIWSLIAGKRSKRTQTEQDEA